MQFSFYERKKMAAISSYYFIKTHSYECGIFNVKEYNIFFQLLN